MDAERIAELRDHPRSVLSPLSECLDEIERLGSLVVAAHRYKPDQDGDELLYPACWGCSWNWINVTNPFEDRYENWEPANGFDDEAASELAHLDHIAALINGVTQ